MTQQRIYFNSRDKLYLDTQKIVYFKGCSNKSIVKKYFLILLILFTFVPLQMLAQTAGGTIKRPDRKAQPSTNTSVKKGDVIKKQSTVQMPEDKQERVVDTEAAGYDVSFTCNVPYATLFIDDMANGTAGGTRFLKTGNHSIKVMADGYESLLQTIVVNSSSTSFSFYLKKMPAPPTDYKQKDEKPSISCPNSNHPHVIDLELPSGTKWACCNVGATSPEKNGNDYAWGVTNIESNNGWKTYKWGRSKTKLTKYNTKKKNGIVDNKVTLDALDDAATVNWGAQWCMPSNAQLLELFTNTSSEWTTLKDVYGRKFTSKKNGRSIFLPAGKAHYSGFYWSKTLYESDPSCAWALYFDRESIINSEHIRNCCFFVRPILKK